MFVFFCRPADALLSSESGGGQGNLATHGTGLYVLSSFLCDACCFVVSFDMRYRLGTSPPRGTGVVPPFHFVLVFAFVSPPPATMVACGRALTVVSLVFAPVFYFNSPFFVSSPPPRRRYAGGF